MQNQLSLEDFLQKEPVLESKDNSEIQEETDQKNQILSVSELNRIIKNKLESSFQLVWIQGEISNFKPHTSGHFYFSLKDEKSQISAVMFKGFNRLLKFKLTDGMEVVVRGKLSLYEPRGSYSIQCEVIEPLGMGALQVAYEQLKNKLQKEGLFDTAKKRSLPSLATRVAIVTSPTGAAIRDMLNVLSRRMKNIEITIFPCAVQGDKAPLEIVSAIESANRVGGYDVMIIGRGGGSIEDLWAFNDERVARAIGNSKIPTVSAVGHEIDFTIADFVADVRAPTPSAAAEIISKNASEMSEKLSMYSNSLRTLLYKNLKIQSQKISNLSFRLIDPRKKLADLFIKSDELLDRLTTSMQNILEKKKLNLQIKASMLDTLSPLKVLDRGYSITENQNGTIIKNIKELKVGDSIKTRLLNGVFESQITKI